MQGPTRNVIVNEDDNRKLGIYTEGDVDAAIDGIGMLGEGASNTLYPLQLDADKNLKIVQGGNTSVGTGTTTVTTAGTKVQLSAIVCKRIFIQAHESNTGTIVVGGANVVAVLATRQGFALFATQGDWFYVNSLSLLYIDSTVNGDKINYYYEV